MSEGVIYWTSLCGNRSISDAFWNTNLTWNTNNPDFTWCFQGTVFVCIPAVFIVISTLCLELLLPKYEHPRYTAKSTLYKIKLLLGLVIITLLLISSSKNVYDIIVENTPALLLVRNVTQLISFLTSCYLLHLQHKRWSHTSGVQICFWSLQLLIGIISMQSTVRQLQQGIALDLFYLVVFYIYLTVVVVEWMLVLIVDKSTLNVQHQSEKQQFMSPVYVNEKTPLLSKASIQDSELTRKVNKDAKESPENSMSFLSNITFFWFYRLLYQGWKKVLEYEDLPDIQEKNKSKYITEAFYRVWNKDKFKVNPQNSSSGLILFWAIVKSIGRPLLYASVFRLATVFVVFAGPFLIRALISYFDSGEEYPWKGYIIAVALFLNNEFSSILIHKFLYHSYNFGTNMRSLVTAIVYRKALRLSSSAKRQTTVGEIVNLMSVDSQKLQDVPAYLCTLWTVPITIILATVFLWQIVGVAALSGLAVIALIVPFNGFYVANKIRLLQAKQMVYKDQRIITINEVLSGIKVIKLYAWERFFQTKISGQREKELQTIKWVNILNAFAAVAWSTSTYLVTVAVFGTYVLISSENILNADTLFVTFSLINILSFPMALFSMAIGFIGQAFVSLQRIQKFLLLEEIDDTAIEMNSLSTKALQLLNGTFSWGVNDPHVLRDIDLSINKGELIAVIGPVGCGKSSLISAILGEMCKHSGRVIISGSIALASQQAWIQHNSLKDNILFGKPENKHLYNKVIKKCCLEHDLEILPDGDNTEIGEKGINLSGGQKQRVSLARAVYQNEDIYLLDDPLSAVDSHVGKHLFEHIIGPTGMLQKKTRVLVTHSLTYLPYVDRIIVMKDGKIQENGSYQQLLKSSSGFAEFLKTYLDDVEDADGQDLEVAQKALSITGEDSDTHGIYSKALSLKQTSITGSVTSKSEDGVSQTQRNRKRKHRKKTESSAVDKMIERQQSQKPKNLIQTETSAAGNVSFGVVIEYLKSARWSILVWTLVFHLLFGISLVLSNIWLSEWSADTPVIINGTATQPPNTMQRLGVYAGLILFQVLSIQIGSIAIAMGCYYASRVLHQNIIARVLRAPMMFFDTTPLGRIMNRCSKDMDYVDVNIPFITRNWLYMLIPLFSILIVISYSTPIFLSVALPIAIIYMLLQRLYIKTARQLKRIDAVKRSPVFVHFDETIVGASSIRAFKRQEEFINKCDEHTDNSQRAWYLVTISMRWLGVVMETLGNLITFFASLFSVIQNSGSSLAGLSVSYSLQIAINMNLFIRWSTELETYFVAIERIKEYSEVTTEADWDKPENAPSISWPREGQVEYRDYTTRYRPELQPVLHSINCVVNPSEKVGVVGRTGAGKSSMALSLFRIIEALGGGIYIDGIKIGDLGLYDLRSRITVIPQDPVIFCGTLRSNLDPLKRCNDQELWTSLELAHLKDFVISTPNGLDYHCGEGGEALSIGQRQLVCLARALLRNNKVLVLDEATSGVDLETDDLIQTTIRTAFTKCTIITIAHRLNTVMDYDRIMVMDNGRIVEFDTPQNLLSNKKTVFYGMAKDAKLC